ncbi:MAG: TRAP transporter small permease, partial [Pseudomonadota bacterium]
MDLVKPAYCMENAINWLSRVVHRLGGVVLAMMMVLTAADVLLRYIFNRPISGAVELNENMLVMLVFFSIAHTGIQKGHVRVELLVARLPPKAQSAIDAISGLVVLALSLMITWQSTVLALEKMKQGMTTAVLFLPVFPFIFMVAFGSGLFSMVLLVDLSHSLARLLRIRWRVSEWVLPLVIFLLLAAAVYLGLESLPSKVSPAQAGYLGLIALVFLLFV